MIAPTVTIDKVRLEVPMAIRYLNTDLDLVSPHDLTALAAAFEASGLFSLHLMHDNADFLTTVEGLSAIGISDWRACTLRELNVGYECGREPSSFSHTLSPGILRRMFAAGAALRITLYPEDRTASDCL